MLPADDILMAVVYVLMILFILIGNTLVIISFAKHRSLRTTTNIFLANVAVADILTALVSVSLAMVLRVVSGAKENYAICMWEITAVLTTVGASNIFVVLANLDRYVAIHWPFHYTKLTCRRNMAVIILSAWSFFLCVGLTAVLGWNNWRVGLDCDFISVLSLGLCFIVVVVYMSMFLGLLLVNVRIFWTAHKQAKRIDDAQLGLRGRIVTVDGTLKPESGLQVDCSDILTSDGPSSCSGSTTSAWSSKTIRRMARANVKAARVVAIVVGVYGLCHFPTACLATHQLRLRLEGHDPHRLYGVFSYLLVLTLLNSGINPVIYYVVMPGFRDAYKKLLCSWRGVR